MTASQLLDVQYSTNCTGLVLTLQIIKSYIESRYRVWQASSVNIGVQELQVSA